MASAATISPTNPEPSRRSFVGRERELSALLAGLDDACAGRGRLILLEGEPGIGKTKLASELAADAAQRGILTLWGRCTDYSGAPAFWPWAQILRRLIDDDDKRRPAILAQILPELGSEPSVAETSSEPNVQRFELFGAVAAVLREAAARQPLLLVLDDLHEADQPTLVLLRYLAGELHDARILLLGSYRPADLERSVERAQLLNPIARAGLRLPMAALSEAQVGDLMGAAFGAPVAATLTASVHRASGGNPLFVTELVHLLLAHGDATPPADLGMLALPHGLREVIRERLRPLAEETRRVLDEASVFGEEIDVAVLQALSSVPATHLGTALLEAERAGLIAALDPLRRTYRFRHELLRDAIYANLEATARARLHQRVALELAAGPGARDGNHTTEIAHHFAQAALLGDVEVAIAYAVRAATEAERHWAYEEADQQYAQALRLLTQGSRNATQQQCELLLAQGRVQHAAGRASSRTTYAAAAVLARQLTESAPADAVRLLAAAALGVADRGLGILQMAPDDMAVALLEEALDALPETEAQLGARLRARLAAHLTFSATESRSLQLIEDATRRARELGDPATLAMVLGQRHLVLWRFNVVPGRLDLATELLELADRLGDRELAWQGRAWRAVDLLTEGDRVGFDADLRLLTTRAEALRQPRFLWLALNMRITRAIFCGQWDEAESLSQQAMPLAAELADPLTSVASAFQLFLIARERGQASDDGMLQLMVHRFPDSPMVRAVQLLTLLDLGRTAEARAVFEYLATGDFALVREERRLGVLALLCDACWRLGDAGRAPVLAKLLRPFAEYTVMYSANACFGAATRFLGQMAALAGDWTAAERHLTAARESNERMGMHVPLAWTELDLADLWVRRAQQATAMPAGKKQAQAALARAQSWAERLSLVRLQTRIDELRPALADEGGAIPSNPVRRPGVFRRDGEYWSISDGEAVVRLKDSKGLQYIAALLARPESEVHVLDLAVGRGAGLAAAGESTPEPMLDPQARRAYRQRLGELRQEIEAAGDLHDLGRIDVLQQEQAQLERELARAAGLHGRTRSTGSQIERARLNVTRAIHTAVRRIAAGNADLGRYFETTIKTGNLCLFRPDPRIPIDWQL